MAIYSFFRSYSIDSHSYPRCFLVRRCSYFFQVIQIADICQNYLCRIQLKSQSYTTQDHNLIMMNRIARAVKGFNLHSHFSTHGPAPSKLEKVEKVLQIVRYNRITFRVKNIYGQWEKIKAQVGEPMLSSLLRSKMKGYSLLGLCGGGDRTYSPWERPVDPFSSGPSCGNCRIVLKDNWYGRIWEQTGGYVRDEEQMLHIRDDHREDVRLSCCIPVQRWMDGCTFEILAETELSELTKYE